MCDVYPVSNTHDSVSTTQFYLDALRKYKQLFLCMVPTKYRNINAEPRVLYFFTTLLILPWWQFHNLKKITKYLKVSDIYTIISNHSHPYLQIIYAESLSTLRFSVC